GELFDTEDRADAELRVPHLHARTQAAERRLIFVLVGVARRLLPGASRPRSVRARLEIAPERALVAALVSGEQRLDPLDELGRHFVHEARRLHRLVLTEYAPPRGAGEHQLVARARHADVAEAPLLVELVFLVEAALVREDAFLEPR